MNHLYIPTWHLHHWQAYHLIIGWPKPLPIWKLQIRLIDLPVQVYSKWPKMRYFLRHIPILIINLLYLSILLRPVVFDHVIQSPPLKSNRVGHSWLFSLIYSIEHFKSIFAYKLVIPINKKTNLIMLAVFSSSKVQVRNSCHLHIIPYQFHLLPSSLILLDKSLQMPTSLIRRGIINNNNMIILVILVQYTL